MPCYLPDSYTCLTRSIRDLQVLPSVTNDCIFIFVADPISQQMKQIIDPHQGVVHVHQIPIRAVGLYAGQVSQNGVEKLFFSHADSSSQKADTSRMMKNPSCPLF